MSWKKDFRKKWERGDILLSGSKVGLVSELSKEVKYNDEINNRTNVCFVAFHGSSNDNYNSILPRDGKDIVSI